MNDKGLVVKIINKVTGGKFQTFDLDAYGSMKALLADVDRATNLWEQIFPHVEFCQKSEPKFG